MGKHADAIENQATLAAKTVYQSFLCYVPRPCTSFQSLTWSIEMHLARQFSTQCPFDQYARRQNLARCPGTRIQAARALRNPALSMGGEEIHPCKRPCTTLCPSFQKRVFFSALPTDTLPRSQTVSQLLTRASAMPSFRCAVMPSVRPSRSPSRPSRLGAPVAAGPEARPSETRPR